MLRVLFAAHAGARVVVEISCRGKGPLSMTKWVFLHTRSPAGTSFLESFVFMARGVSTILASTGLVALLLLLRGGFKSLRELVAVVRNSRESMLILLLRSDVLWLILRQLQVIIQSIPQELQHRSCFGLITGNVCLHETGKTMRVVRESSGSSSKIGVSIEGLCHLFNMISHVMKLPLVLSGQAGPLFRSL